jgi:hypothetical protein
MKTAIIFIVGTALLNLFPIGELTEEYEASYLGKTQKAFEYAKNHNMDTSICFLIDMKAHMGKKRFAIWNFSGDSIQEQMIVTHGSAGSKGLATSGADSPIFSNIPGSYASSLGHYRIGKRSYSNWGINIHYKLHGLDSSNSNVFRRIVVLHSYEMVSKDEVYPEIPPYSLGCPMVSNEDMTYLDSLLKTKKDVLMWIYN